MTLKMFGVIASGCADQAVPAPSWPRLRRRLLAGGRFLLWRRLLWRCLLWRADGGHRAADDERRHLYLQAGRAVGLGASASAECHAVRSALRVQLLERAGDGARALRRRADRQRHALLLIAGRVSPARCNA